MNEWPMITPGIAQGLRIVASPVLAKMHIVRKERKWAHRMMWKKEQRFKIISTEVITTECMQHGDTLYVSPLMAKMIRDGVPPAYSMGAHFDESRVPKSKSNVSYEINFPTQAGNV